MRRAKPPLVVAGAFAAAAVGWLAGGWAAATAGVPDLDLVARAAAVFWALSLGEAASARLGSHD